MCAKRLSSLNPITLNPLQQLRISEHLFGEGWSRLLVGEVAKKYFDYIRATVKKEREKYSVYPDTDKVFKAYTLTDPASVRVVILGQDPYPTPGDACGLAFSVERSLDDLGRIPPTLKNILDEVEREYPDCIPMEKNPDLTRWAEQGVLLLNTSLTVRSGQIGSHSRIGWSKLIKATIRALGQRHKGCGPVVYMLWGSHARSFKEIIEQQPNSVILETSHPSPRAVELGFRGCNHFRLANEALPPSKQVKWAD